MSTSISNHKINTYVKNYKDDIILDQIVAALNNLTVKNRKQCIKECKEMIKTVQNIESKKYIRTLHYLEEIEVSHMIDKLDEKIEAKPKKTVRIIDTFENWISNDKENTELRIFLNLPNQYSESEQIYFSRQIVTEYTKYVSACSKQLVIPSPFPNIEMVNRICESIKLDDGRMIKNPNYIPEYKAPFCICC